MLYVKNLHSKKPKEWLKQYCQEIKSLIKEQNIEVVVMEYCHYEIKSYIKSLQSVDFVVVLEDECIETQGLSAAEAWAQNKPTFANYQINEFGGTTLPYLCAQNGAYYKDLHELKGLIRRFYSDVDFRLSFSPANFVRENMSDEVSIKQLMEICNASSNKAI